MCGRGECDRNEIKTVAEVWGERIDFGGKVGNEGGIGLRRVCVGSTETSEGLYDEFRIR